jgi:hypothetical protein
MRRARRIAASFGGRTTLPINTVAPAVTGTETVGQTLSVTDGTWLNVPTSYTYQWFRAITSGGVIVTSGAFFTGVAIGGATSATYVLQAGDSGEKLYCEVTATNANGSTMKQSNATGAIAAAAGLDGSESDGTQLLAGPATFATDWSVSEASISTGAAAAPNGANDAAQFRGTTNNSRHIIYQLVGTISANTQYTASIYAKQNQYRYLQLILASGSTGTKLAIYFDLQTGTVTDTEIISSAGSVIASTSMAAAVNGFYKCSVTFTLDNVSTSVYFQPGLSDVATYAAPLQFDTPQFAGANATDNVLVWRPKLVLG